LTLNPYLNFRNIAFKSGSKPADRQEETVDEAGQTPDVILEARYQRINRELEEKLMKNVKYCSPMLQPKSI